MMEDQRIRDYDKKIKEKKDNFIKFKLEQAEKELRIAQQKAKEEQIKREQAEKELRLAMQKAKEEQMSRAIEQPYQPYIDEHNQKKNIMLGQRPLDWNIEEMVQRHK